MELREVFRRVPYLRHQIDLRVRCGAEDKDRVYSDCKRMAEQAVGWYAEDKELRTSEAYDAVIRYICRVLDY